MTIPKPPAYDTGNHLLGETPAQLTTVVLDTPRGQRLALTIRTPSTTLTVLLSKDDASAWARNLQATAGQMSGAGLIIAGPGNGQVIPKEHG